MASYVTYYTSSQPTNQPKKKNNKEAENDIRQKKKEKETEGEIAEMLDVPPTPEVSCLSLWRLMRQNLNSWFIWNGKQRNSFSCE